MKKTLLQVIAWAAVGFDGIVILAGGNLKDAAIGLIVGAACGIASSV
jgi:hypothetical protein